MPAYLRLVPLVVAVALIFILRLGLVRRRATGRRGRRAGGLPVFALLPLVMIGIAALSGAFSALGTPLGAALAPFTFGSGIGLGTLMGRSRNGPGGETGSRRAGLGSFWIFLGVVTVRIGVVLISGGPSTRSVAGIISADLMLLSVGMALTRLAMMWRGRARYPYLSPPAEAESPSYEIPA